jgi:hypothetical protein
MANSQGYATKLAPALGKRKFHIGFVLIRDI